MSAKIREPTETTEEIRFEDLDLIYMFSFDLGGFIEKVEYLEREFSSKYGLTEGIWTPSSDEREFTLEFARRKAKELGIEDAENASAKELKANEELMKELNKAIAMFRLIISKNYEACNPEYLEQGRYVRLKLIDLNLRIEDPEFKIKDLDKELRCELYLLLHNTGVAIVTAWIHLDGDLLVDDLIEIEEKKLYEVKCTINSPLGESKEKTLSDFIYDKIITPLRNEFEKKLGHEKLRPLYSYYMVSTVVCIRKYRCQDECTTAKDVVERHPREIYGILQGYRDWRSCQVDIIKEELKDLSPSKDYAMFTEGFFIGSTALYENLSEENQELAYREYELYLVLPLELLLLSDLILHVYSSIYQDRLKDFRKRIEERKLVRPSEIVSIMKDLTYGLEEYNNVLVFTKEPYRRVVEYGKKHLRLLDEADMLRSGLRELNDMARTCYDEEILGALVKLIAQEGKLSKIHVLSTILFGLFTTVMSSEFLRLVFESLKVINIIPILRDIEIAAGVTAISAFVSEVVFLFVEKMRERYKERQI
jgi:hypothetical protein